LATAKLGGILFEITPFGNPHHLKKNERITVDAETFERYQGIRTYEGRMRPDEGDH
jgi:hypothetical protein